MFGGEFKGVGFEKLVKGSLLKPAARRGKSTSLYRIQVLQVEGK